MVYLIDPVVGKNPKCPAKIGCTEFCGIKPCYGVIVVPE